MSWFKRTPRQRTVEKPKPHRTSPLSQQAMQQTEDKTKPKKDNKENKNE